MPAEQLEQIAYSCIKTILKHIHKNAELDKNDFSLLKEAIKTADRLLQEPIAGYNLINTHRSIIGDFKDTEEELDESTLVKRLGQCYCQS